MAYELIVLCRRTPPQPPQGWPVDIEKVRFEEVPGSAFGQAAQEHLGAAAVSAIIGKRDDSGSEFILSGLSQRLADASDGVIVERIPVLIPPRYRVRYEGRTRHCTWTELMASLHGKPPHGDRPIADAEAESRARWRASLSQETDRHVLCEALLTQLPGKLDADTVRQLRSEQWLEQATVDELRTWVLRLADSRRPSDDS